MTDKKPSGGVREYRKYRDGLYIPHRYILYSYWFQFLKIGYEEKRKSGSNLSLGREGLQNFE